MFDVTQKSPNRVDVALSGQIDADEMRASLTALFDASSGMKGGVMLYRITDFSLPTLGAIGVEISQLPQLFGLIGKFSKCAVLTDAAWLRHTAEIEGKLIPGLAIKTFEIDDVVAAEAWLAQG